MLLDQHARHSTSLSDPSESRDRISLALNAVLTSLATVRLAVTPAEIVDQAPQKLCAAGVFERVMYSPVSRSTWSPESIYVLDSNRNVTLHVEGSPNEQLEDLQVPLISPLVEAEVARRRLPALVQDAQDEPRVYRPLIERMQACEYIVAPVVTGTTVIGFMHADRPTDGGPLTTAHRDLLRMFAEGVGVSYEQRALAARIERQRQRVIDVCQAATESASATTSVLGIALRPKKCADVDQFRRDHSAAPRAPHSPQARDSRRMKSLTSREREVLALLASGATNGQLADQLTVAESTIKSHVKHILHKLGASNRAAAISYYVRDTKCGDRSPQ